MRINSVSGLVLGRQGISGPPWYTSWSWRTAKASVATLARLEPLVLAGGHGTPLTGAQTAAALRAFAEGLRRPRLDLKDCAPSFEYGPKTPPSDLGFGLPAGEGRGTACAKSRLAGFGQRR